MSRLELRDVCKEFVTGRYPSRRRTVAAEGISLAIQRGEVVALVGESGSGKTTLGRILVGLETATAGTVLLDDRDLATGTKQEQRALRRRVQMVFQNTQSAFNPRRRVRQILADPIRIHGLARGKAIFDRAEELFLEVGLEPAMLDRYPHEFSGGQRQRINIARALTLGPDFLVADEPVSALDVSVQAQILNLLARLRSEQDMGMLFISHDMRAVSFICDRIAVLYRGRLVEVGSRDDILSSPSHPYTQALVDAVPVLDGGRARLDAVTKIGEASSTPTEGCNFRDRCPLRAALGNPSICEEVRPELRATGSSEAACHFAHVAEPTEAAA